MIEGKLKYGEKLLRKIDSKKKLSEEELKELINDFEVETEEGDEDSSNMTIIHLGERFFAIDWECGEYYCQPVEVESKTYDKTITVTEWVPKVS